MLGIALAADDLAGMAAPVKRQEVRLVTRQPRGHVDLVRVGREVDERPPLEGEERGAGVAIRLVLAHGVLPALAGAGVLEFDGRDGQAVDGEQHVERAGVAGVARHLPRDREAVLVEEVDGVEVRAVRGLGVREPEELAVEFEAVAQNMQRALGVQFLDQRRDERRLQRRPVQRAHVGPELGLCGRDEGTHLRGKECQFLVPAAEGAPRPAALGQQYLLDVGLEGMLVRCLHKVTWPSNKKKHHVWSYGVQSNRTFSS